MLLQNDLPPGLQKIIACIAGIGLHDGKDEMQIRMLQMLELKTGGTRAATVFRRPVRTIEVLGIGERQLQFADTRYTRKELRMRNSSLTHRLTQLLLRRLLSYDLTEKAIRFLGDYT